MGLLLGRRTAPLLLATAVTMTNALKKAVTGLPIQLWRSLTWDRGKELSDHVRFTMESGVKVFFADPHSPWQRGTNENTNGLLRQYFPKGTDLSRWSAQEIQAVAHTLNTRPRKTLGWKTPAEALNDYLKSFQQPSVATTGWIRPGFLYLSDGSAAEWFDVDSLLDAAPELPTRCAGFHGRDSPQSFAKTRPSQGSDRPHLLG